MAGKLNLNEVETIRLPNGQSLIVENIPSNITTHFEVTDKGEVEHHQELLLENAPGKVVSGLNRSKVGGFSWACKGADGGAMGVTRISDFKGFDYVLNPGFSANRGYILESADDKARDMILENIAKTGIKDKAAEEMLDNWVSTAQLRVLDLEDRLDHAAIYEDALREKIEVRDDQIGKLKKTVEESTAAVQASTTAAEARKQIITEGAGKSAIVIPDRVKDALISMATEEDFAELVGFFENAAKVNLDGLPVGNKGQETVPAHPGVPEDPEWGTAAAGADMDGSPYDFGR